MSYIIGIDLGTTNSCCAVWRNNAVEIIPDSMTKQRTIPSVVSFTNISRYVGQEAKNQLDLNPDNSIYEVKRLIGLKYSEIIDELEFITYKVKPDENDNIIINDKYTPEEISSHILSKIKIMASEYLGVNVCKAVISVPANFNDSQRQATKDAAQIAGLECIRIIHEPTAAALAYGSNSTNMNVIIYDFGGGTLDVSLLNICDGLFEVLASSGISHLGGSDFDKRIMMHCLSTFKRKYKLTDEDTNKISNLNMQKLRKASENAKKILSVSVHTFITIPNFYKDMNLHIKLSRDKLEHICGDLLLMALDPLKEVLEMNDMKPIDINEVVMVGGMTRMPIIRDSVAKYMNNKPNISIDPDEVVAFGCAIQASLLSGDNPFEENMRLLDRLPLSLGIEVMNSSMDKLILKNSIIPCSKKRRYTTCEDFVDEVNIKIFEGERKMTKNNYLLGEFVLSGLTKVPRGIPIIEVIFDVDVNGILSVKATDRENNNTKELKVSGNKSRLSQEQINILVEEAKKYELQDKLYKLKKQLYYELDDLCTTVLYNINNDKTFLKQEDKEKTVKDICRIIEFSKSKSYFDILETEYTSNINYIKSTYTHLLLKIILNKNETNEIKSANNNVCNSTNIFNDDDEQDICNKNIEDNENGDEDIEPTKPSSINYMKQTLTEICNNMHELCYSSSNTLTTDDTDIIKNLIDDTLLWIYVSDYATDKDYELKINELNNRTNEIMNKYEQKQNSNIDNLLNLCNSLVDILPEYNHTDDIYECINAINREPNKTDEYCVSMINKLNILSDKLIELNNVHDIQDDMSLTSVNDILAKNVKQDC